jgi:hypothetical protein
MTNFLLLALWTVAAPAAEIPRIVTLFDDTVEVRPAHFRALELPTGAAEARIVCTFEVAAAPSGVRALLLRPDDAARWAAGAPHAVLTGTGWGRRGAFSQLVRGASSYAVVLDNSLDARGPARVHLMIRLVYGATATGPVRFPATRKGTLLVWTSIGLFLGAVALASARLHRALEQRHTS